MGLISVVITVIRKLKKLAKYIVRSNGKFLKEFASSNHIKAHCFLIYRSCGYLSSLKIKNRIVVWRITFEELSVNKVY